MASIRKIPDRKSKPWRVDIRRKGVDPITQTFRTQKEARAFVAKVEGDFDTWAKLLGGELRRHTLADLCDKFMESYKGKDRSVVSRAGWWKDTYGDQSLAEFNADTVRAGLAELDDGTRTPATLNRYRTAISMVYKMGIDRGWYGVSVNPAGGIRQRREANSRFGRCLDDDERKALLTACDASDWPGLGVFVRIALATGARKGELIKLEWRNVDLKRGTLTFHDTKNADDRTVPLIPEALTLLKGWSKVRRLTNPAVFPHPEDDEKLCPIDWHWKLARTAAGLTDFRIHDLRHSCGTYLARNGASAFQIAAVLGHRSGPTLTARYVHAVAEDSRGLLESALSGALGAGDD